MVRNKRSGYARDIMPERVEGEERSGKAIKPRDLTRGEFAGIAEGAVCPADRVYNADYKVVTVQEAMDNMVARIKGEKDLIKGGLDSELADALPEAIQKDLRMTKKSNKVAAVPSAKQPRVKDNYDPFGEGARDGNAVAEPIDDEDPGDMTEPTEAEIRAEEELLATKQSAFDTPRQAQRPVQARVQVQMPSYLSKRCRVTLGMVSGDMSIQAISVIEARYGITILLPLSDDGATFIPKPGSEISVGWNEKQCNCFFPGVTFDIPELKVMGLVFIKAEES